MWRGVTKVRPIRTGASFVGLGTHRHRVVFYPISAPDPITGLADINWIAEITVDNSAGWADCDRTRLLRGQEALQLRCPVTDRVSGKPALTGGRDNLA